MNTAILIVKELWHRKVNFVLGVLAVVTAVALYIAFFTAAQASNRETARLMLTMGYNLRIIPADTNMNRFLLTDIPDKTMPADYLKRLGNARSVSYNHLIATLQRRITFRDYDVVLTGIEPEVYSSGRKLMPGTIILEKGTAYVGHRIAQDLGIEEQQTIKVGPVTLKVIRTLEESGGVDDIRLHCHIADAQAILNEPGRISEIQAVDCLCFDTSRDAATVLREEIGKLLPEARVIQLKSLAGARTKQRQMVRRLFELVMPMIVMVCGVWIAVLAVMNVRDRQQEIGIMRALGYGSTKIATLFLGKAVLSGLIGAAIGFAAGTVLAMHFGPDIFKMTAKAMVRPEVHLLWRAMIAAPVFAAISSFIPAMLAVAYDPAVTLREE